MCEHGKFKYGIFLGERERERDRVEKWENHEKLKKSRGLGKEGSVGGARKWGECFRLLLNILQFVSVFASRPPFLLVSSMFSTMVFPHGPVSTRGANALL